MTLSLNPKDTAFILGSGFSANAGIPPQSSLSENFFAPLKDGEDSICKYCRKIVLYFSDLVFKYKPDVSAPSVVPDIEDFFTLIDLSASTGHYLGRELRPNILRAIRRAGIFLILHIINESRGPQSGVTDHAKNFVDKFVNNNKFYNFISTNWDIVLENRISPNIGINYFISSSFDNNITGSEFCNIAKVHGSSNWMYCENCKTITVERNQKNTVDGKINLNMQEIRSMNEELILGLTRLELKNIERALTLAPRECDPCKVNMASHIATFSFTKSFNTPHFPHVWFEAENMLARNKNWVFIGYSLPKADYVFNHLLKTANMRGEDEKQIIAVGLKPQNGDDLTRSRYSQFFGSQLVDYYDAGLEGFMKKVNNG